MVSKNLKKMSAAICTIFMFCLLYAQQEITLLDPEKITDVTSNETEIIIRSNKQKENVYINGEFVGLTPLTIKKLVPAEYRLTIKSGSSEKTFIIEVKRFQLLEFYVDMQKQNDSTSPEKQNDSKKYVYKNGPRANTTSK